MSDPSHADTPSDDTEAAELDRLYQQALDAMDAIETDLNRASEVLSGDTEPADDEQTDGGIPADEAHRAGDVADESSPPAGESVQHEPGSATTESAPRVTPQQIIEAVLFVGGGPRTTKKLCSVLGGGFDVNFVDQTVESLNRQYAAQGRPYEIRFGEGGYRMILRESFESVRNRLFGFGPKEVKLSRDALDVLALVAYRQPISPEEVEQTGKTNAPGVLRHLLRRELVAIERGESGRNDVRYTTTPRFLRLFGLSHLDELPQAEDLDFK